MIHVLHLVSSFERAVAEARRVLAPGGVLFRHITRYQGDSPWQPGQQKWDEMLAARHFARHRSPSPEQVGDALRAVGGACRRVVYAEIEERTTPAENLDRIRRRVDSWSWEIPDDLFAECLAEYEGWLARRYPEIRQEFVVQVSHELEVWSFA